MKLEQVPAGMQDIYEGVANEDFENPQVINVIGDGKPSVKKTEAKKVELTVPAGTVGGNTAFTVRIDGHVGDGDANVDSEFDYDTIASDATSVSFTKVRREPIPQTPPEASRRR